MAEPKQDPQGAIIRPYAVTLGRTEPRQDIALEAVFTASPSARQEARFAGHDKLRIANTCGDRPMSLAEIAAYTRLPLGVARLLVADMVAEGLLDLHSTAAPMGYQERMDLLDRVLSGLRGLSPHDHHFKTDESPRRATSDATEIVSSVRSKVAKLRRKRRSGHSSRAGSGLFDKLGLRRPRRKTAGSSAREDLKSVFEELNDHARDFLAEFELSTSGSTLGGSRDNA